MASDHTQTRPMHITSRKPAKVHAASMPMCQWNDKLTTTQNMQALRWQTCQRPSFSQPTHADRLYKRSNPGQCYTCKHLARMHGNCMVIATAAIIIVT